MNEGLEILLGIFLLVGMHILAILVGAVITWIFVTVQVYGMASLMLAGVLGIGIAQLLYVIPVILWLRRQRKWGLMKGVIIGAVLTALLNGGCWLWLYSINS